jgi:hypothetical protein
MGRYRVDAPDGTSTQCKMPLTTLMGVWFSSSPLMCISKHELTGRSIYMHFTKKNGERK